MGKLKVLASPLTGRIYAGKPDKTGEAFSSGKDDVTIDCLVAVVTHCQKFGGCIELYNPETGKVEFEIEVRDIS